MTTGDYYRGGNDLTPKIREVRIDWRTGLLRGTHGVSVYDRPDGLDRFGGAYQLGPLPPELEIIKRGEDPHHFEIVPALPITLPQYEDALHKINLTPV